MLWLFIFRGHFSEGNIGVSLVGELIDEFMIFDFCFEDMYDFWGDVVPIFVFCFEGYFLKVVAIDAFVQFGHFVLQEIE